MHSLSIVSTRSEQPASNVPQYENTELPSSSPSTDQDNNMYEQIELKTTTDHGKHIELSQNAAYGRVQR